MTSYQKLVCMTVICLLGWLSQAAGVRANPANATALCAVVPNAPACHGGAQADCATCHTGAPALNAYGTCLKAAIAHSSSVENAISQIMNTDCDGDGRSNGDELKAGTNPGIPDATSGANAAPSTAQGSCQARSTASGWNLCGYDYTYAYKRVFQDFCASSPTFAAISQFKQQPDATKPQIIAQAAANCMQTNAWRGKGGLLWDMAAIKVRPLAVIKSGDDGGDIPLADYYDDYNLYIYHQLDDADVRGVFTADYYVTRQDGQTTDYTVVDEVPLNPLKPGVLAVTASFYNGVQQFVPKEKRAGVLSTAWTGIGLSMFASIPRTTAAHFYRVYLGLDISKSQGLSDPGNDFQLVDYDNKGVTKPACAACHRTLDALAYPFTTYNGLTFNILGKDINTAGGFIGGAVDGNVSLPPFLASIVSTGSKVFGSNMLLLGEYNENRIKILSGMNAGTEPNLAATPSHGSILGRNVTNLQEWAEVAANSDEFAKQVVLDYWRFLIGEDPNPQTQSDFDALVENLKTKHNYRVKEMLLDLIARNVYGAP
jgi:hypothetical protein